MATRDRLATVAGPALRRAREQRDSALESPVHSTRTAAILGVALGVCFTTCFLTGLLSHLIQHPPTWFHYPARPAGLYRFTQGLHVATGTAAVPLLLAKLWTVSPHLIVWPPVRNVVHALERLSLIPLVAGSLFMLGSGLANVAKWYPYPFAFVPAHFAVAWITIGALVVHIGAKISATRSALRGGDDTQLADAPVAVLSRRGFLGSVGAATGVLTLATIGQTLRPLSRIAWLAPRRSGGGVQGVPINRSAVEANVIELAHSPDYRLTIGGRVDQQLTFTVAELERMERHEATLPISCVEGWSTSATWRGIRVRDLLQRAGARPGATLRVDSLERAGAYVSSDLDADHAHDRDTLLALELNGERLVTDHGYPVRLIAPNRPGVMQTKWVTHLEVQ